MTTMRVAQVSRPDGPFEIVTRPVCQPSAGEVRVKVEACGVCHSDAYAKRAAFPGIELPRVPGHEVIGRVDALGDGVVGFKVGDRVGVGWHGGQCGHCDPCRRGDFFACQTFHRITGITTDGGYGEYVVAHQSALARVPAGLTAEEAAPLMCAGVTTFNSLRNCGARAGDLVAVLGLGGLGHLAVQFAAKMGFRVAGIARGADKASFARELGAHHYIDSLVQDPAAALREFGGARVILATVTNAEAMQACMGGLGPRGTFLVVGAVPALQVPPLQMIGGNQSVRGWYSGTAIDSQDTLAFCALSGVRSMNEVYPLARVADAYEHMMSGRARFRVVLKV
ncbi:MAG TPA: alcohol dehydrogenase [Steroidobacteraceae bacterium]|nr:alcohol dehydrogenase [Steroidobacteraceae bacterium]HQR49268.1 alcohol dehydrogenase [Steroidobacteraceae bacterium]